MNPPKCQIQDIPQMADHTIPLKLRSLKQYVRLAVHRYLSPEQKRAIKKRATRLKIWLTTRKSPSESPVNPAPASVPAKLVAGDRVRVRSLDEIRATLDAWGEVRHCAFMPEMEPYCSTEQRVLKRENAFWMNGIIKSKRHRALFCLKGQYAKVRSFLDRAIVLVFSSGGRSG